MRVTWVGPLAKASAVARITELMAPELGRRCDLTIVHPADEDARPVPVKAFAAADAHHATPMVADSDLAVYSIGDSYEFHLLPYELSQRLPGVVVLADGVLQHLFGEVAMRTDDPTKSYVDLVERSGGPALVDRALDLLSQVWIAQFGSRPDLVDAFPLLEPALLGALGVVVASEHGRDRVAEVFDGPIAVVRHPCALDGVALPPRAPGGGDRLLVISTGHVNPNRHVDVVVRAIASDPVLRTRVRYVVAGPMSPWMEAELPALVAEHGLEDVVEFRGRVSEAELHRLLTTADLAVNLRWPVMETGSASLVEQMWCGVPVVVLAEGHYDEYPDAAVAKVRSLEPAAVAHALHGLVSDQARRRDMGSAAEAFVREHHTVERYCRELAQFFEVAAQAAPMLKGADALGRRLGETFGRLEAADLSAEAAAIDQLFAHVPTLLRTPGLVLPSGELSRPVTEPRS